MQPVIAAVMVSSAGLRRALSGIASNTKMGLSKFVNEKYVTSISQKCLKGIWLALILCVSRVNRLFLYYFLSSFEDMFIDSRERERDQCEREALISLPPICAPTRN